MIKSLGPVIVITPVYQVIFGGRSPTDLVPTGHDPCPVILDNDARAARLERVIDPGGKDLGRPGRAECDLCGWCAVFPRQGCKKASPNTACKNLQVPCAVRSLCFKFGGISAVHTEKIRPSGISAGLSFPNKYL